LGNSRGDPFAFGTGLCVELLFRTHLFKSGDRCDAGYFEYGKWDGGVAFGTLDRSKDLVLCRLKIILRGFPFIRVCQDSSNVGLAKLLDHGIALRYRFTAAKLFVDR